VLRLAAIPSSPSRWLRRRPIRLLALLAVRDDLGYLPGYIASVGPQTDGIVALDDGSSDGSAEFLESCEEVIELIRIPRDRAAWDEVGNYRRLVEAGVRHGADWLVSLDADERVERQFRRRLEWVIARGRLLGLSSYQVRLRELWDSPDHYRTDGIWGEKIRARIFRARQQASFDDRPLHGLKVPLEESRVRRYPVADLELYHLRMMRPADRRARRERYELADPDSIWQPGIGYAYLTDENDLRTEPIDPERDYERGERQGPR
jgi:glycosyltransferase involved in cell wall biosynthesis